MKVLRSLKYNPTPVKGGYTDRILKVNLNSNTIIIQELPTGYKEKYIGGRGYALQLIWEGTSKETRYDSPE
ncbi:MAG: hypothetical protein JRJ02_06310, partial [Deltaproteobacteria bacterium]|nr:hypothetical protein [Deltaproteobacteria bacterium]